MSSIIRHSRQSVLVSTVSISCIGFLFSSKSYCSVARHNTHVKIPPRYGTWIPSHLSPKWRRALTSTSQQSITKDKIEIFDANIPSSNNQRKDCPMCKKYSQGPCGQFFNDWLSCIDSNVGFEQKCDEYAKNLKLCLDKHKSYYENIDSYGETLDEKDDERIQKWHSFIAALEEDGTILPFEEGNLSPEIQIRWKIKMGAAMFHPTTSTFGDMLLMAYIKDQNGRILGAGSVEELFYWNEPDDEGGTLNTNPSENDDQSGKFVLRFQLDDTTTHVTAYALYGSEYENHEDKNDYIPVIRWRKLQIKR